MIRKIVELYRAAYQAKRSEILLNDPLVAQLIALAYAQGKTDAEKHFLECADCYARLNPETRKPGVPLPH